MKPNDKQWGKDVKALVAILEKKLEPQELLELHRIAFSDPPGGPFFDSLSAKVVALFPEVFADPIDEDEIEDDDIPSNEEEYIPSEKD
jgi:hypothetical protein